MGVFSEVLTKFDMTTKREVSQDLKPNWIKKNPRSLQKILSVHEKINPFSEEENKDLLFNKGTGKSSKQDTSEFCWMPIRWLVKGYRKTPLCYAIRAQNVAHCYVEACDHMFYLVIRLHTICGNMIQSAAFRHLLWFQNTAAYRFLNLT